jgi:hypothetical protein
LQTAIALDLGSRFDVSVDKDLIASQPNLCRRYGCRFNQSYSLVDRIEILRLINVSEIALTALQVLQLNPHALGTKSGHYRAMRAKGPL